MNEFWGNVSKNMYQIPEIFQFNGTVESCKHVALMLNVSLSVNMIYSG